MTSTDETKLFPNQSKDSIISSESNNNLDVLLDSALTIQESDPTEVQRRCQTAVDDDDNKEKEEEKTNNNHSINQQPKKELKTILKRRGSSINLNLSNSQSSSKLNFSNSQSAAKLNVSNSQSVKDSLDSTLSQSGKAMRRSSSVVSFKSVEIREYDRTIGDNPSCMSGPPISLDWSYSKEFEICIEQHEKSKEMGRNKNGRKKQVVQRLGKLKRIEMLQNQMGYSEEEIQLATKEKKDIQRSRSMTNLISPFWRVEHAVQSLQRKIKRKMRSSSSSTLNELDVSHSKSLDRASASINLEPSLEI